MGQWWWTERRKPVKHACGQSSPSSLTHSTHRAPWTRDEWAKSVETGVRSHRVIRAQGCREHSERLSRDTDGRGSLSHSSPLLYLPACVSWPLKLKWRHGRKDGATQTRRSFQSFLSHRQVKKRVRWHIRILISKIKPGGCVMLSRSSS